LVFAHGTGFLAKHAGPGPIYCLSAYKTEGLVQPSPLDSSRTLAQTLVPQTPGGGGGGEEERRSKMIYDVNSPLFRSFLSQKGGASDKRYLSAHHCVSS